MTAMHRDYRVNLMSQSWISLLSITELEFQALVSEANRIRNQTQTSGANSGKSFALVFFEPSTRTRLSFERAAQLIQAQTFSLVGSEFTSIEKGESQEETLLNIASMNPTALIIRCGDELDLDRISNSIRAPIICAGWGKKHHPTQALLDAYTLNELWGSLNNKKILFVGDAKHSRVLSSHLELLPMLKVEIGFWCPDEFRLSQPLGPTFRSKHEALEWADVVIGLRLQKERMTSAVTWSEAQSRYQISKKDIDQLDKKLPVMHPGPVGWGSEFHVDLKDYSQSLILSQVTHGVYLRAALLNKIGGSL